MRKFDRDQVLRLAALQTAGGGPVLRLVATAPPAADRLPQGDQLRSLVKFAISQGYYERWNNPADPV